MSFCSLNYHWFSLICWFVTSDYYLKQTCLDLFDHLKQNWSGSGMGNYFNCDYSTICIVITTPNRTIATTRFGLTCFSSSVHIWSIFFYYCTHLHSCSNFQVVATFYLQLLKCIWVVIIRVVDPLSSDVTRQFVKLLF
jgi:hypothetical protein